MTVQDSQVRRYNPAESVVFFKTRERFGGLSNMAAGFPLEVNDFPIRTSEALYQACRFPHKPDVQRRIVAERSPMTAKMRGKPFRKQSRPDWMSVRVKIMRWCLRVKLAQNLEEFGDLLLATGDRPIVERSRKDDYWGTKAGEDGMLTGKNVLGRLLMELRNELGSKGREHFVVVEPLPICDFRLFEVPIGRVDEGALARPAGKAERRPMYLVPPQSGHAQRDLLEQPDRYFSGSGVARIVTASRRGRRKAEGEPSGDPTVAAGDGGMRSCRSVPPGWSERRFKYLAQTVKGRIPPSAKDDSPNDKTAPYLSMEYLRGEIENPVFVKADHDSLYAENGNVLLLWDGANAGEFCIAKAGIVSSTMAKIISASVDDRFLFWMCKGHESFVRSETIGMGIPHVNGYSLANMSVPLPPFSRQRAIADWLDRETAWLDALMTAKDRMLKLLAEKRQVLITCAVTRGIGPSVLPCTSGMSWSGEVPAHWRIGRLKDFGSLIAGAGFPHEFQGVEGEILPFYKVGDLATSRDDRYMVQPSNTVSPETATRLRARVIPEGAIVYAKIGAALLLNRRRITTAPCVIDNNMTAYIPSKENLTSGWAFYWTSILDFGMPANPGAVPSLSEGDQAQLPIAIPPVDEQRAIIDYLDRETGRLDELATKTRETIALLKERRAALIAAAVTGRIGMERAA